MNKIREAVLLQRIIDKISTKIEETFQTKDEKDVSFLKGYLCGMAQITSILGEEFNKIDELNETKTI